MTTRTDTWMPLYVGDYMRDTGDLTTVQHGAYLLLIMQAWTRGGALPTNMERLRNMTRMSVVEWKKSCDTLLAFFTLEEDGYRHKRVDHELRNATAMIEQRRKAGLASAEKRKVEREANERSTGVEIPNQQSGKPSPSQRKKETELRSVPKKTRRTAIDPNWKPNEGGIAAAAENGIDLARQVPQFINHHLSKGSVMADWDRAWLTWCGNDYGGKRLVPKAPSSVAQFAERMRPAEQPDLGPIFEGEIVQ